MTNREIENLMAKIEELQFEDYIEIESENKNSSQYERGFNMGVGLCLTILDELRDELSTN